MTRVAEVVVSWGDEVLEVRHVRPRREVRTSAPMTAPVVVERGGRVCCLTPEGARGALVTRGAYRSLSALDDRQLAPDPSGARLLALTDDAIARVDVGALTFQVRSTAPARATPRSTPSRAPAACALLSLLTHAPLIAMLALAPPRAAASKLERVTEARRLVEVEHEPVIESRARWLLGGTGERHAQDDGAMGSPREIAITPRYAVPRDGRDAQAELARARPPERIESVGAIGVLRAALDTWDAPASPYGAERARGHDERAALGVLMGDTARGAHGALGLGMRGTGRGAGGSGAGTIGLGALGTLGHGSGCVGRGCEHGSGYGRGRGGLAARRSRAPRSHCVPSRPCGAAVRGALSRDVVRRVVRRRLAEVRFCYEQHLQDDPSLEGRVRVQWIIGADGRVTSASLASSSVGSAGVERCVVSAVRRWTFPSGASPTGVTYPFVLRST